MPPPVIKLGKQAGEHGSYAFYRSFQYMSKGRWRHVQLGKFFFVQVGKSSPICIGELQLVWTGRYSNHPLASIRLYYLPEQLPDGRQSHHGQDELVATEKMVLHAKDLIKWIIFDGVDWGLGLCVQPQKNTDCQCKSSDGLHCNVQVTNFNVYCRVRTALKRNEGQLFNELRKDPHSAAIYNLGAVGAADYILFCKETFENPDLDNHEYRCDHLAPNLKGRPRKKGKGKGGKVKQSVNSSAAPTLKPTKTEPTTKQKDSGEKMLKQILNNKEQFSKSLYKFMKDQGTPISKVPSLGFKKVDLFIFFKHAHNIGGYKEICRKRLWKHIYDRLGGNPHNTSAATCTKRHYERLLLSFEKHVASLTSGAAHTIHTKSTTDNCPLKTKKCLVIKDEKRVQHATSSEGERLDDDRKSNRKHKQPLTRSESPLDAEDYIPLSRLTAIKTEKLQANSVASEIATTEVEEKTAVLTAAPGVVAAKATWSVPQACHSEQVNRVKNTKPPKKLVTKYLDSIPISSATVTKKLGSVPGPESSIAIIESRPQVISAGVKAEPKTEPEAPKLIPAHCVLKASMPLNVLGPCYPDLLTAAQQSPWKVRLYNIYPDPTFVGTDMTPDSFKITDLKRTISDNEALDLSAKRRKTIPKAHGEWEAPPSTDTCGAVDLTIDYDKPLSLVVKNKSHDRQQRQQQQDEPLNFSTPKSAIQPPPLVHRDQTRPTPPAKPIPQISTARINQHKKVHTQGYPPIQNHPHAPNPSHVPNHQQAHEKRRSSSMQLYVPARPTAAHYPKSAVITSHRMATPQYQAMTPMPVSHGQAKLNAIPNQPTNVLSNITPPSHSARPQRREDIPQKAYPVGREDIPQKAYPVGAPKQSDDRKHYIDLTRHDKQKGSSAHTMHQSPQMRQALNHTVKSAHHSPNQTMHSPKLYSPNHPTNMTRSASADKAVRHHELPPRYEDIQRHNEQLLSKAGSWSTNDPPRYREESVAAVIGIRPSGQRSETSFHRAPRPHRYSELALRHEAPNMHYDHRPGAHAAHQRNAVRSVFGRAGLVSPPYHTAYSQHTQQNSLHRPAMGSSRSKVSITSATVPHMQRLPYHQRPEATATAPQYTQYLPAPPRLQPIPSSHRTAQPASNHDVYAYDKSSKW